MPRNFDFDPSSHSIDPDDSHLSIWGQGLFDDQFQSFSSLHQIIDPANIAGYEEPHDVSTGWESASQCPGSYGATFQGDDLPQPPTIAPRLMMITAESFDHVHLEAPLPPDNNPSPKPMGEQLGGSTRDFYDWFEIPQESDNVNFVGSSDQMIIPNMIIPQLDIPVGSEYALEHASEHVSEYAPEPGELRTQLNSTTGPQLEDSRCFSCTLVHGSKVKCGGMVGATCRRCLRLLSNVTKKTTRQVEASLKRSNGSRQRFFEFLIEPTERLHLPQVIYFELVETQRFLAALRLEVDEVSSLRKETSLESLFDGNLLCHVDDKAYFDPYSTTSSAVAIRRLATTTSSVQVQDSEVVPPALDPAQLDRFINRRQPCRKFSNFSEVDQETLDISWKCSYWLTILLGWDRHEIYLEPLSPQSLVLIDAKNVILELAYAISHRVQSLVMKLCSRAIESMSSNSGQHNPLVICCALWMVYSAAKKFQKKNFKASSLENLRVFLSKLRERSKAAMQSIDQYKWLVSAYSCGLARDNNGTFSELIKDAKSPKSTLSFAFERHHPGSIWKLGTGSLNSGVRPQSYSEILESKVSFLEEADLYYGLASRGLQVPWPADRVDTLDSSPHDPPQHISPSLIMGRAAPESDFTGNFTPDSMEFYWGQQELPNTLPESFPNFGESDGTRLATGFKSAPTLATRTKKRRRGKRIRLSP